MKKYILKFKGDYKKDVKINFIGNIFDNFDLIECDEENYEILLNSPMVENIEEDLENKPCQNNGALYMPNDISLINQNGRDREFRGQGVNIAILDSGLNLNHENLQINITNVARILENNVVSVGVRDDVIDNTGHGTAVTSVLGAQGLNNIYGVAPEANYIIVRITQPNSESSSNSTIATAIRWAVDNGADVINVSYAQNVYSEIVASACIYAENNNVSVVVSAGNDGSLYSPNEQQLYNNVALWNQYFSPIVVGGVNNPNNFNGRRIIDFPKEFYSYSNRLIYFNPDSNRYRVVLSDGPTFLEPTTDSSTLYALHIPGYNEYWDYFPLSSNQWVRTLNRQSSDAIINFTFTLEQLRERILLTNHQIINTMDNNSLFKDRTSQAVYFEHVYNNYNDVLTDIDINNSQNIVRASQSSFGKGIDFVAPYYFNTAWIGSTNSYRDVSGTSFSAPYVSGVIALIKQRFPEFDREDINDYLRASALKVGNGDQRYYGGGLISITDLSLDYLYRVYNNHVKYNLRNAIPLTE